MNVFIAKHAGNFKYNPNFFLQLFFTHDCCVLSNILAGYIDISFLSSVDDEGYFPNMEVISNCTLSAICHYAKQQMSERKAITSSN